MSKGKQTQATNQTNNATTAQNSTLSGTATPTAPDWISTALQGLTGKVGALGSADPQSYVAGTNPLLNQAGAGAESLSGSPWDFDAAASTTGGVINKAAPDIASLTSKFMDPYLKDVVGATSNDLDHSDNLARQQFDLQNADAFGGSGLSLTKSATEDALSRARGTTLGNLRSQGYAQALGGATSQAQLLDAAQNRKLTAAQQLANIGSQYDANQRANIGTQATLGTLDRGIATDQARAPLDLASWQNSTLPDLLAKFFGQNTTGTTATNGTSSGTSSGTGTGTATPGTLSSLGDVAALASLFMSDRRLKRDVQRIGTRRDGLGLYVYRYLWSPLRFIGVMAQEVLAVKPEAVVTLPNGFMAVDYNLLGEGV